MGKRHSDHRGLRGMRTKIIRFLMRVAVVALGWGAAMLVGNHVDAAQNVVVVLDDSGSMRQTMRTDRRHVSRIQAARDALSKVVQGLAPDAQLGILLLNHRGRGHEWLVPIGPLNVSQTLAKIATIEANGGTPLGSQMRVAADALLEHRQKQIYGDFRLLVITDGEANDSNLLTAYLPDLLSRGILLDVIGVDMQANHSLAASAHSYRRADDAQSFEKALAEVFAETNTASDQDGSDYAQIADLPDELATQVLASLAIPRNERLTMARAGGVDFAAPTAHQPASPTPPQGSSSPVVVSNPPAPTGIVGFLSALPCFLFVVILFIMVAAVSQGKNRKNRR